jgi:hypothetical protein
VSPSACRGTCGGGRAGASSVWAEGKEQAPAIGAEATGDRAEKADAETNRPLYRMPSRGEGIKTMEAKAFIKRYSAGERDFSWGYPDRGQGDQRAARYGRAFQGRGHA